MQDLEIIFEKSIGTLALIGETLGNHNISLEGGGVFVNGGYSIAHFLVNEATKAKDLLHEAGFNNIKINEVIIQKLKQDVPGQLGLFCKRLADAGIQVLVQYSDHSNQLIIVADNYNKTKQVSDAWIKEMWFTE